MCAEHPDVLPMIGTGECLAPAGESSDGYQQLGNFRAAPGIRWQIVTLAGPQLRRTGGQGAVRAGATYIATVFRILSDDSWSFNSSITRTRPSQPMVS